MEILKQYYAFIVCILLLLLSSCVWTEVYEPEPIPQIEYRKKPHKDFDSTSINVVIDSTLNEDTTRILITFNPSVEDWEETNL